MNQYTGRRQMLLKCPQIVRGKFLPNPAKPNVTNTRLSSVLTNVRHTTTIEALMYVCIRDSSNVGWAQICPRGCRPVRHKPAAFAFSQSQLPF
jgi:hypothetical protein